MRPVFFPVLVVAVVSACLPDLSEDNPVASVASCGDGLIDLDHESCDPGPAPTVGCSSACAITCEGALAADTGHCYFPVGKASSFVDATAACRNASAHLVTLASPAETALATALAAGPIWVDRTRSAAIGAFVSSQPTEPGSALAPTTGPCSGCYAPGADASTGEFEPAGALDCVAAQTAGFSAAACTQAPLDVVCEREPAGSTTTTCSAGLCTPLVARDKVVVTSIVASDYDAGRARCATLGGSPWVIDGVEERLLVARELTNVFAAGGLAWVGLSFEAGAWRWDDDRADRVIPWGNAEPAAVGPAAAVLALQPGAYDTTLLRAEPRAATHPMLCELAAAR